MTTDMVIQIAYQALYTVLLIAAPMLLAGLLVGLVVGIFQAATSIHEMTLTFIPKIVAVFLAVIIFLPWMLRTIIGFTVQLYGLLATITG